MVHRRTRFCGWVGFLALFAAVTFAWPVRSSDAQHRPVTRPVPTRVVPLLEDAEPSLSVPTSDLRFSRVDRSSGVSRALYRGSLDSMVVGRLAPPMRSSDDELRRNAANVVERLGRRVGVSNSDELALVSVKRTSSTAHVTWRQAVGGVPVYGRYIRVSVDADGRPTFVMNGYDATLVDRLSASGPLPDRLSPRVSEANAMSVAGELFGATARTNEHDLELVVVPEDAPYLAWRVIVTSDEFPGEWEVLVDAASGRPVQVRDRAIRRRDAPWMAVTPSAPDRSTGGGVSVVAHTNGLTVSHATAALAVRVDGSGRIFEPDPLTSAGASYGPPFVDGDDADVAAINAELKDVVLRDITRGADNNYRLEGPYARIVGGGPLNYTPPAEPSTTFVYTRSDDAFEAVNAYYHVDQSQRYVRGIGFVDIQANGVTINPQAVVGDDSFYLPNANQINFGVGGVDDAEDAGVILHEYGHALLNGSAPGLVDQTEGRALHEGWADYWAGSYLRGLVEAGKSARLDWESVFRWDSGDGQIWAGRTIGVPGVYRIDTTCHAGSQVACDFYVDGLIWASALMEIYDELGKATTDRLNLQSHQYLAPPATFRDAAEALVQADQDLFAGANVSVLTSVLTARGYLTSNEAAPVVVHEPLSDSESLGGNVDVRVTASSTVAAIDSVRIVYQFEGGFDESIRLFNTSGSSYTTPFALPVEEGMVEYQIEAYDSDGRVVTLPANAPVQRFSFFVGPDVVAPVVQHTPAASVSTVSWPPRVVAVVSDNLGIGNVNVGWQLRQPGGAVAAAGSFPLIAVPGGATYQGSFPIDRNDVVDGSSIEYSISAVDASQAGNTTRNPSTGEHSVVVRSSGELLALDFESPNSGITGSGTWERGAPFSPLSTAHSGLVVWATGLGTPYASTPQTSRLSLPVLDLEGLTTKLVFWHWYDFEHSGDVTPGSVNPEARLWDGGNVKASVDGGPFQELVPTGGYNGIVASGGGNPLAGQQVFGGYSYGWRREVVDLPSATNVRIRFDFGSDNGNEESSLAFAGWFIDDISIVTEIAPDATAPIVASGPPPRVIRPTAEPATRLVVEATDNVGIERMELVAEPGSAVSPIQSRFDMERSGLEVFSLDLDPTDVQVGDRLAYRVHIVDYAGNETYLPGLDADPAIIDYRTVGNTNVLADAVGSGTWSQIGNTWTADPDAAEAPVYSTLVLPPVTIADNIEEARMEVVHSHQLDEDSGANVKISRDDGRTWELLVPATAYDERWAGSGHPLANEDVFRGARYSRVSLFDLSAYVGEVVRLRFDSGFTSGSAAESFWAIDSATLQSTTVDAELNGPGKLTLNANFPDPFSAATTITYTLPVDEVVMVSLYDVLGRRVRVLAYEPQPAGAHTLQLTSDGLADGVYFVSLVAGDERASERIVVAR